VRWEKLTKGKRVKIPSDQSRSGQRRNRVAFMTQSVNWVLDADGRSFFDSVDHEWLLRMVAHGFPTEGFCGSSADGFGPA